MYVIIGFIPLLFYFLNKQFTVKIEFLTYKYQQTNTLFIQEQ